MAAPAPTAVNAAASSARIRRSMLLLGAVAVLFYFGSIAVLVWRAGK